MKFRLSQTECFFFSLELLILKIQQIFSRSFLEFEECSNMIWLEAVLEWKLKNFPNIRKIYEHLCSNFLWKLKMRTIFSQIVCSHHFLVMAKTKHSKKKCSIYSRFGCFFPFNFISSASLYFTSPDSIHTICMRSTWR